MGDLLGLRLPYESAAAGLDHLHAERPEDESATVAWTVAPAGSESRVSGAESPFHAPCQRAAAGLILLGVTSGYTEKRRRPGEARRRGQ